ncbi:hypothetical protein GGX14DRAFT_392242 [Mycena pura]|uniref:Uncharacterized protein n=1 Tax=Mycena pura TaxID=153505 RepID=A0AAD6YHZ7_9AGAR|nr:hypothetical protein GGX14DRAFT_392242 [Mycena pura]
MASDQDGDYRLDDVRGKLGQIARSTKGPRSQSSDKKPTLAKLYQQGQQPQLCGPPNLAICTAHLPSNSFLFLLLQANDADNPTGSAVFWQAERELLGKAVASLNNIEEQEDLEEEKQRHPKGEGGALWVGIEWGKHFLCALELLLYNLIK